jgi:divalent metal cation (Fe/Co/Zn/Cd) transporter
MERQPDRSIAIDQTQQSHLLRRGLALEYLTLGWNVVGVVVVGFAAMAAHSVALAGFGLDSLIEIFASVVVVWHLTGAGGDKEKLALRMIGAAFIALAVYVVVQTVYVLTAGGRPAPSPAGIAWLTATVIAMLALARGKLVTGRRLDNAVLIAESRVTVIDAYLAAAVLVGVALNTFAGWWWADPLAGLVIVYYAVVEGVAHWREGSSVMA